MEEGEDDTTTIKVGLAKALQLPSLEPIIEGCVRYVSELTVRGSRILNGFLIHITETGEPLSIDTKGKRELLVKQAFTLGLPHAKAKKTPFPGLEPWWSLNQDRYPVAPTAPPIPSKEISDYAARTYATNFHNNLWKHHEGRLLKYLRARFGPDANAVIQRIHRRSHQWHIAPTLEQLECIKEEREALGLADGWGPTHMLGERRLKSNSTTCITRGADYLRCVEAHSVSLKDGDPSHLKLWSLAPLSTRRRHYVTIDTEVLMQMMIVAGAIPRQELDKFWPLAPDHFQSVFVVRRGKTGASHQLKTRCYMQTDGVVLAAQFQPVSKERIKGGKRAEAAEKKRKRKEAEAAAEEARDPVAASTSAPTPFVSDIQRRADERRKICADPDSFRGRRDLEKFYCDPGRVNMLYMVRARDGKVFRLTRKQYYQDAGINKSMAAWADWNAPLAVHYQALSGNSPKTASVERYNAFLEADAAGAAAIWAVNYARRASRMRFHTHVGKQRVLQGFLGKLGNGLGTGEEQRRRVVVAYGQAKFASHGRAGELAVPVTDCFKQCAKMWSTCLVDENYTSVVCHDCDGRLVDVKTRKLLRVPNGNGGVRVVRADNRAVHRCINVCKATGLSLKHREYNAAMNIGRVFEAVLSGVARPTVLTRGGAPRAPG